jgi:hypothetical protein
VSARLYPSVTQLRYKEAQRRPCRALVSDGPADLAVHLMANTAITGATFDIDGGQQLVEG